MLPSFRDDGGQRGLDKWRDKFALLGIRCRPHEGWAGAEGGGGSGVAAAGRVVILVFT